MVLLVFEFVFRIYSVIFLRIRNVFKKFNRGGSVTAVVEEMMKKSNHLSRDE